MKNIKKKIRSLGKKKNKVSINYIPWNDYQYFEDLCKEDGGVIEEHFGIYKNFNVVKEKESIDDLMEEIDKCNTYPYLHSKNGNEKFYYDLHIWINNHYIIYNPVHKKFLEKKMSILERLFYPVISPDWDTGNE